MQELATIDNCTCRSNILLDEHLTPKIGDFGFSIQVPQESCSKTLITVGPGQGIPGTPGYRAPEYNDGRYSVKSDVYSYGVVSIDYAWLYNYNYVLAAYMQVVLETFTGLIAFSDCRTDSNLVCILGYNYYVYLCDYV